MKLMNNLSFFILYFSESTSALAKDIPECFQKNVNFNQGQAIAQKSLGDHHQCQKWCQLVRRCTHFSFNTINKICYLRQGDRSQPQPGVISGPKSCSERVNMSDNTPVCDQEGGLCLTGSKSRHSGNVMIADKPVCDDEWGLEEAAVVCRQLGFSGVERASLESEFGTVSSTFAMDNVRCVGNETRLTDCRHKSGDDCDGHEAAGVVCTNNSVTLPSHCQEDTAICLAGGPDHRTGNVYYGGKPVCHNGWDFSDANVVCKMMGYPGAENFTIGSKFGLATSHFRMSGVRCRGDEEDIRSCPHDSNGDGCGTETVAGVVCSPAGHHINIKPIVHFELIIGLSVITIIIVLIFVIILRYMNRDLRQKSNIENSVKGISKVAFVNPILKKSQDDRIVNKSDLHNLQI